MVDCSVQDFDIDNDNCTASGGLPVGTDSGIALSCNASVIDKVVNAPKGAIIKNRKGDTLKPLADIAGGSKIDDTYVFIDDYIGLYSSVSDAIQCAANSAKASGKTLFAADTSKSYLLDKPVDLKGLDNIFITTPIDTTLLDETEIAVTIGGLAETDSSGRIVFGEFISSNPQLANDATAFPQLQIRGLKGMELRFDGIRSRQWWQQGGVDQEDSNAYNNIYDSGRVCKEEITGELGPNGEIAWCNENKFFGGRRYKIIFRDYGYPNNHNKFYDPLFEDEQAELRIEYGDSNWFYGVRWERVSSGLGMYFGENTINNHVYMTWISSLQAREMYQNPMKGAPKTDLGRGNVVAYQNAAEAQFRTVFSFDASTTMLSYGTNFDQPSTSVVSGILSSPTIQTGNKRAAVLPGLVFGNKIKVPVESKQLAESNIIPVKRGSTFGYVAEISSGSWVFIVKCFDENMQPLDEPNALSIPAANYQPTNDGTYITGNRQSTDESNTGAQWPLTFSVLSANCKYIWTSCVTGSTTDNEINYIACRYYEDAQQDFKAMSAIDSQPQPAYLKEAPKYGIAETGQIVDTDSGQFKCTLSLRTKVVGAVASGDTLVIDVDQNDLTTSKVQAGDSVGVVTSDNGVHWSTVETFDDSTNTVVMVDPIPSGLTILNHAVCGLCRWTSAEQGKPYEPKTSSFVAQPNSRYFIRDGLTITTPDSAMVGDVIELIISAGAVDIPGGKFVTLNSTSNISYYDDNGTRIASSNPVTLAGAGQIWNVSEGFAISVIWNSSFWEISR